MREARNWEDAAVWQLAAYVTAFAPEPAVARWVIQGLFDPHRGAAVPVEMQWFGALLHLSSGQWTAAQDARVAALAAGRTLADRHRQVFGAASEWWLATLPLPYPDSTLRRMRASATSFDPVHRETGGGLEPHAALAERLWLEGFGDPGRLDALRQYTVGMLSLRLADSAAVAAAAASLARLAASDEANPLVRDLNRGLQARIAWHEGRPEHGLGLLEELELGPISISALNIVPFAARAHERYLRGELLVALGRYEEALPWFASLAGLSVPEAPYRAPAHLRQAEFHERLGNRAEAARHYTRFVELWQESDPAFRPLVEQARRRLGSPL